MQAKILAALIAALPLLASAQSNVTIYGIVDGSIAREDTGAPDGERTTIASGNQSTSRIGFRGTEELGNDLKALFALEAGVAIDTGIGDSALFGRRAVVGLQGGFGTVTLGREYGPIADVANASDILGQGFYGTNLSAFNAGRLTRRISNSINYRSPTTGPFKFGASYGAGETSGGPSMDIMGVSAEYTVGIFYVGAGYQVLERLASGDDKEAIIGAGLKLGAIDIKGNYMVADPTGGNNQFEQFNLGASYTFGANKLYLNLQQNELDNGARGRGASVAFSHTLSKRTNVYLAASYLRNNNLGVFGFNSAGTSVTPPATAPGADPRAIALGVRHSF